MNKKPDCVKVTFRLEVDIKKKLNLFCLENDTTLQKLFEDFVKDMLKLGRAQ
jgi:hypothetical protein